MANNGSILNRGNFTINNNNAQLLSGTLQNNASMTWSADFTGAQPFVNWQISGQIINNGTWTMATVSGRTLRINPQALAASGRIANGANGGTILVTGSGSAEITNLAQGNALPSFTNSGSIRVQGGRLSFSRADYECFAYGYNNNRP
jgi:hypothetical protein